jgi:hypothetical protein
MTKIIPKILCPCCGRYAWQSQLDKLHKRPLLVVAKYIGGGRRKDWIQFQEVRDLGMVKQVREYLKHRCAQIMTWLDVEYDVPAEIVTFETVPVHQFDFNAQTELEVGGETQHG